MANETANEYTEYIANLVSGHTYKICLMAEGFTFDRDNHDTYADISAFELPNGFGYTTGGNTLAGAVVTRDDVNDETVISFNNTQWTAAGGDIGPTVGAAIYDVTAGNVIVGYIDFEGSYTEENGGVATIADPEIAYEGVNE